MNIQISKNTVISYIYLSIIVIAGLSTILRPAINSKITLFRVLLPFLILFFIAIKPKKGVHFLLILLLLLVYSIFISLFISRFETFSFIFFFYYSVVIFFYFFSEELIKTVTVIRTYRFLKNLFKVLIILGYLQYFFDGIYFNTQDRLPAVNVFFWNENEYSSVLAVFIPLFFLKEKSSLKYFWIFLSLFLLIHNDAKLAIISNILFFGGYIVLKFKLFKLKYIGIFSLFIILSCILFFGRDYRIQGTYTIDIFLSGLYNHIISQETFPHIGTFNARSNAIILGIKEFINSGFLGIGPGNSLPMMKEIVIPGTEKYTALSMHNFIMQVITEIGILGISFLLFIYFRVKKAIKRNIIFSSNIIFLYYASTIISISLLSGPWSNYFYLFIFYFSIYFFESNISTIENKNTISVREV